MAHGRVPQPFELREPLDYEDAREAGKEYARLRAEAVGALEAAVADAKDKIVAYRKALSEGFVSAQGKTAAEREADARKRASEAEADRFFAEQMIKVAQQKLEAIDGHRATFHRLVEWSAQLDPTVAEVRARRREVNQ